MTRSLCACYMFANINQTTTWDNNDRSLLPWEILATCEELLSKERARLIRTSLLGERLEYSDTSLTGVDGMESARDFLSDIESYVRTKAMAQAKLRERYGLPSALTKEDTKKWKPPNSSFPGNISLYLACNWTDNKQ